MVYSIMIIATSQIHIRNQVQARIEHKEIKIKTFATNLT